MGAIDLYARPSKDFEAKLAETKALLKRAAAEFQPLKQASGLGAEGVVIMHIVESLGLDIPVFVLDTGMLPWQTLALLEGGQGARAAAYVVASVLLSVGATWAGALLARRG